MCFNGFMTISEYNHMYDFICTVCVGVVKSGKGNRMLMDTTGMDWNLFLHKCNYLDFSNFSVQIAHHL